MRRLILFIIVLICFVALSFSYEKDEAKVLFVGDMFFDRYIRQVMAAKGPDFIFSCIGPFLKDSDLVVGNLEGPITVDRSVSWGSVIGSPQNYIFTFPTTTAELLAKNNIKLVSLGNNHISNFGLDGIFSTKKYLNKADVRYFGGLGRDLPVQAEEQIYRTVLAENQISFISYNEFGGDSAEKVAKKISDEKSQGRTVFVYAHWGDEYIEPPERVKKVAKLFADSGADFIIGSHPHVILPSESISSAQNKKTVVYYSLGNFIFDQYWNKEVSTGLVLEVNITGNPDKWRIIEHRVSLGRDGRTCLTN